MEKKDILPARIPTATYRLQFNHLFKFSDAKKIINYLHDLGISDIYSSPYFKAKEGSLHGYDIVDPTVLNPEVGTEEQYSELINELQKYEMGQILDIVPNHMCIDSKDNTWWMDVLENGPSSVYADFFDIDWKPVKGELKDRILLPILGNQYGNILEGQELKLAFEGGEFFVYYHTNKFPIMPETYIYILKHRIDDIERLLSPDDSNFMELLSIITALNHLPPYIEREPEKIAERYREKEVIKKRLLNLYSESPDVKVFVDENVRIFNGIENEPMSFDLLDTLLSKQVYRLSYWRVAAEEINYRRFFDINSLAAIRVEHPIVFQKTHQLIFELIKEGKITGLRVDHPDGLYDPSEYFQQLQQNCFVQMRLPHTKKIRDNMPQDCKAPDIEPDIETEILKLYDEVVSSHSQYKPFYIIGEKILTKGEKISEEWPIFGTTGYEIMNSLSGIFVETKNAKAFDSVYKKFAALSINFQDIAYEKRKLVMQVSMSSEINTLGHYLNTISEKDRHMRDFTLNSLTNTIAEIIACFPVYRTYINTWDDIKDKSRQYIELAVSKARRKNPSMSESIFDFLRDVLLLRFPGDFESNDKKEWLNFVRKFQQTTGPVMAKGLEDTAFYVYNRLISLNEVGGTPDRFGTPIDAFHGQNIERIKFWPHATVATSTHDSKRSEDVRARINVLSEMPERWKECLLKWKRFNKKKKVIVNGQIVPDGNEEYLFYQTLVGVWPIIYDFSLLCERRLKGRSKLLSEAQYNIFKNRIKDYMLKAIREAKVNTSWINPDTKYEEAMIVFIESTMNCNPSNHFLKDFQAFCKLISHYGMYNSLSQTLLKITSPGVPDFYQGAEMWDFSLVDPDNRRPVDYGVRSQMLEELKKYESKVAQADIMRKLTVSKEDGRIKLYLIYKALDFRRKNRELFDKGEYIPLDAIGEKHDNVCAFARRLGSKEVIVVVPRFLTKLTSYADSLPFGREVWKDSFTVVPFAEEGAKYLNIFTGEEVAVKNSDGATALYLSEVFANSPVALMERMMYNQR